MSITKIGKVSELFVSRKDSQERVSKEIISLDVRGILQDKYHNTDIQRSVLITSLSSYELVKQYDITMPFGSLGENLLIDYHPYDLHSGSQLQIGTTILEISQNCTICNHLSIIDERLPELLKNDRGIFAKVIQEGKIKIEDTIYLIN